MTHEQAVFICNDHVMTTISAGYGLIYLTPNQMVDFSAGEAVIKFDLSTLKTSSRDWVDLWVTPYDEHLALPLQADLPDLNGPPRRAVHIAQGWGGHTFYYGEVLRNFVPDWPRLFTQDFGIESILTPSAAIREPFELRISRTRVKFGLPTRNRWWVDEPIADLGWSRGVVQFGHHTYIAQKDCIRWNGTGYESMGAQDSCPNTWHWDNISINPNVPFTILKADRRFADATSPSVGFAAPAPEGAHLRFGGVGGSIDVSFNGGASWQPAQNPPQDSGNPGGFWSFWTPIPAGTTQVRFRGTDGTHPWMARDIAIFATGAQPPPPPTATPTPPPPTPTITPTPEQGVCVAHFYLNGQDTSLRRQAPLADCGR
jgi:hypothetical protein